MELRAIGEHLEDNKEFEKNPICQQSLEMTLNFYRSVGFSPPWIGYYAIKENQVVGCAGFKGRPIDNKVEIAYATFEMYQGQGVGTQICKLLVDLSLTEDRTVRILARTLPEKNFSTRILEKNSFKFIGNVNDPDDGDVWEWEFFD